MDAKELRSFAADCLRVAAGCQDTEMAAGLRKLAAEYLDCADEIARPVGQQQQQIQPNKNDDKTRS
jgi:hypothetical protein